MEREAAVAAAPRAARQAGHEVAAAPAPAVEAVDLAAAEDQAPEARP